MFTHKHYVPILKAKEGEFRALQETRTATKDLMTPLFDVINIPWDYVNDVESKTIDDHLNNIGKKILDYWGQERRFFLDSDLIDGDRLMNDGLTHHLTYLFNDFRAKGIIGVPVTGLQRSANYKAAINGILNTDQRGVCLRLQNSDLTDSELKNIIDTDLAFYNLTPANIDLIIDLEGIEGNPDLLVLTVSTIINNAVPYIENWKSITVAATGFPSDLSDIKADTIDSIDRTEWLMWANLITKNLKRLPTFGDYGIAHPEIVEMDPRTMRVSASIRYTHDDYWVIVRGKWLLKHGHGQYRNLCANLIARPEYSGVAFSWGDNYINDCANEAVGTGNPGIWRKVGNNHHFQKVVTQISNLP